MKYACALVLVASAVTALSLPQNQQTALKDQVAGPEESFLVELQPGETRWVTENEKWVLRRVRREEKCSSLPLTLYHRKVATLWT
jgi:bacterial leucyl aminopeptidase